MTNIELPPSTVIIDLLRNIFYLVWCLFLETANVESDKVIGYHEIMTSIELPPSDSVIIDLLRFPPRVHDLKILFTV